jgi:hypothetical protein
MVGQRFIEPSSHASAPCPQAGQARKEMDGCTALISGAIFFNRNLNYPIENH